MKTFIAVCFFATIALTQGQQLTAEQTAKLKEHIKICIDSSKVNPEFVSKARTNEFTEDPALYTFFDCTFKRVGFIDENGVIKPEVILAKLPPGVSETDAKTVIETCTKKIENESKEKLAFSAYKCYLVETPVKLQLLQE